MLFFDLKIVPKFVTAAASSSLNSPSLLVSHLVMQMALTLASAKEIAGMMSTVTLHCAEKFVPSAVVAVMMAVPLATAVTTPSLLTVATAVSLLVHVTFLLVALDGVIVAMSVDD